MVCEARAAEWAAMIDGEVIKTSTLPRIDPLPLVRTDPPGHRSWR